MVNTAQLTPGAWLIVRIPLAEMSALDAYRKSNGLTRDVAVMKVVQEALEHRGHYAAPARPALPPWPHGSEVRLPAFSREQASRPKRYSDAGITLETVNSYIQVEARSSPAFLEGLFRAAELPPPLQVQGFRSAPGSAREWIVDAVGADDQRLRLIVGATISERTYWKKTFARSQITNKRKSGTVVGLVMLAPRILFEQTWQDVPEEWTFEYIKCLASPQLQKVLDEAIACGKESLHHVGASGMNMGILMGRLHGTL
jgi:hypothetical protein